ncbi:hypothetical protein [Aestuariivita boseongensis]|uniref:hypothetical protein n=1 Tax=Aestuariivita boseongensis TaxID=1470562 RepID=UPI000682B192|nr:hypothetical protein [Aestuariivita boseongensis]
MLKKTLLATTIVTFGATAAFAEGGNATKPMKPKMTAEQIETYSTMQHEATGSSAGIVLPLVLLFLVACAVACGGGGKSYMYYPNT